MELSTYTPMRGHPRGGRRLLAEDWYNARCVVIPVFLTLHKFPAAKLSDSTRSISSLHGWSSQPRRHQTAHRTGTASRLKTTCTTARAMNSPFFTNCPTRPLLAEVGRTTTSRLPRSGIDVLYTQSQQPEVFLSDIFRQKRAAKRLPSTARDHSITTEGCLKYHLRA